MSTLPDGKPFLLEAPTSALVALFAFRLKYSSPSHHQNTYISIYGGTSAILSLLTLASEY